jgi:hypothetical protein
MHKMFADIGLQLFVTKFTTAEFRINISERGTSIKFGDTIG